MRAIGLAQVIRIELAGVKRGWPGLGVKKYGSTNMHSVCFVICLFLAGCTEKPRPWEGAQMSAGDHLTETFSKEKTINEEKQFKDTFKNARGGDAQAQFELSVIYWSGGTEDIKIPKDLGKSIQWMSLAAENGNTQAQYQLAECYLNGLGVPKCYEKSMRWYRKAVENGRVRAWGKIGDMYFYGLGVPIDYDEAFSCYEKGANYFDPYSANQLASCYNEGLGTDIDLVRAFDGYKKALELAENEIINACVPSDEQIQEISIIRCNYATCLLFGEGSPRNIEIALVELIKSAQQGNYLAALYLEDLAAGGNAKAEESLKILNISKTSIKVEEPKIGLRTKEIYRPYFRKGGDKDSSRGRELNETGYRTWYGYGFRRDLMGARKFFSQAHEIGDPEGSRNFALTWFEPAWADQSDGEDRIFGLQILKEAAEKGDLRAKELLKGSYWKELEAFTLRGPIDVGEMVKPAKKNSPFLERGK